MAEEAIIDVQDNQEPLSNPHEEIARQGGWKPLEEWDKAPEDWIDAKEFNLRGEYMDRIKSQSSLIKKLEKKLGNLEMTTAELADHHRKVKETEYQRALQDFKALKREALDMGDNEKVVEIDDRIDDLKKSYKPVEVTQEGLHPDVVQWMEDNPWYKEDPALAGAANGIVQNLLSTDPSLQGQVKEVLERATTKLKEEFPQKFNGKPRNTKVTEPSTSDNNTATPKPAKYTARHLNEEQKRIAKRFVDQKAVKSMDEYAQQLADIGALDAQNKGA
jgi:hypothetical protein